MRSAMRHGRRRATETDVEALLQAELIAVQAGPRPAEDPPKLPPSPGCSMSALPPCVDGSELARTFFAYAVLVGAPMCSACFLRFT